MTGIPVLPAEYGDVDLLVIGGSKAYGLDTPESDTDYKGLYTAPLDQIVGLGGCHPTWDTHDPVDVQMHEAGKFCHLALGGNPTILEVLSCPPIAVSPFGQALIDNRRWFYSNKVFNSFGGYANQQFRRLANRGDGSFSADTRKRTEKHARHMRRLLLQGQQLIATGDLNVRLTPSQVKLVRDFSVLPLDDMTVAAEEAFAEFDATPSVLPDEPNYDAVNRLLVAHRLRPLTDQAYAPVDPDTAGWPVYGPDDE